MRRLAGWSALLLPWSALACLLIFEGLPTIEMSSRQAGLLGASLAASLATALLSLLLGGGAALWAILGRGGRLKTALPLLTLGAVLPPIITASAALTLFSRISPSMTQGWAPAIVVQALTLAPLAALILILTFQSLSGDEVEAASVFLDPACAYQKVLFPLSWQGIVTALAAGVLLSALDFTVPTLFGLTTSMVEVYSDATSGSPILSAAWPHLVLSTGLACLAGAWMAKASAPRSDSRSAQWPTPSILTRGISSSLAFALGGAYLFVIVLLALQAMMHPQSGAALADSLPDAGVSLFIALCTGIITILLGLAGGRELSMHRSWIVWAIALAPACFPPALVGSAGVHLTSLLRIEGVLAPALIQSLRFLPLFAALSAVWWSRMDHQVIDASQVFLSPGRRILKATLPLHAPGLVIGFILVFALSLGELGATLLVIPPGMSTLTLRLYNFLHYGSAPDSAILTLLLVGSACLPLLLVPIVKRWSSA